MNHRLMHPISVSAATFPCKVYSSRVEDAFWECDAKYHTYKYSDCRTCIGSSPASFDGGARGVQAVVLTATLLMAAFLVLLQLPAAVSPLWLPWLATLWGITFPMALLLQVGAPPFP